MFKNQEEATKKYESWEELSKGLFGDPKGNSIEEKAGFFKKVLGEEKKFTVDNEEIPNIATLLFDLKLMDHFGKKANELECLGD